MANIIQQKRSAVAGAVPTAAQLAVGEIAVNTADGKAYTLNAAGEVVELTIPTVADGGEIFSPAVISDLAIWYDPSREDGYIASGGEVSEITDLSGNNRRLVQTFVATAKPTLFEAVNDVQNTTRALLNNQQALFFDGINDYFRTTGIPNNDALTNNIAGFTMFGVIKPTVFGTTRSWHSTAWASNAASIDVGTTAGGFPVFKVRDGGLNTNSTTAVTPLQLNTTYVYALVIDYQAARVKFYINGRVWGTRNLTAGPGNNSEAINIFLRTLGNFNANSQFFRGLMGETLCYPRALNDSELALIETYLASKWGATYTARLAPLSDPDAQRWVDDVYAAGSSVEPGVAAAVNDFVLGCKSDGIWDAMKSCCILCGADTLAGALSPLKGVAPTNFNFVEADYSKTTGILSTSGKYLNTNRAENVDPLDSRHLFIYATELVGGNPNWIGTPHNRISRGSSSMFFQCNNSAVQRGAAQNSIRGIGWSKGSSTTLQERIQNETRSYSHAATGTASLNYTLFSRADQPTNTLSGRVAFYSIGEHLNLTLLDNRVTTLINALGAL